MRYIGEFTRSPNVKFTCGAKVVIQTKRGIEIGEQVSLTCSGCDKAVSREKMKEWVERCGSDSFIFDAGRLLREATAADLAEYARIEAGSRDKRHFSQEIADRLGLALRVVECEYLFGGERIIFFFTAPERVDYRAMVKELAKEYRTRIEMRQIGARDEARILTDYETCGREVCCKVFLKTLRPISMRMAKLQKATLDPSQVSGRCGRLKCCLRYEHTGYEELDKQLPRVGIRIRTSQGEGVVAARQIITQLVQIRTDADELIGVVAEDIIEVGVERSAAPPPAQSALPPATEKASPPSSRKGAAPKAGPSRRSTRRRSGRAKKAGKSRAESGGPGEGKETKRRPAESATPTGSTDKDAQEKKAKRSGRRRRGPRSRRRRRQGDGKPGGGAPPSPEG
ncbi:MAG: PSP1 domain-containing protein [Planctomycetota bacterium]|jgi:cell fate regulator YaaT (PSP1 superfamily)